MPFPEEQLAAKRPDSIRPRTAFTVVANSGEVAVRTAGRAFTGTHSIGEHLPVKREGGSAFVEIRDFGPSEVLVLSSRL